MKETVKKNKQSHQHQRFTWFGFWPTSTGDDGEFHSIKDKDYKYGIEALSNPKTPIHPNSSLSHK